MRFFWGGVLVCLVFSVVLFLVFVCGDGSYAGLGLGFFVRMYLKHVGGG
jgi:hypothetical protein